MTAIERSPAADGGGARANALRLAAAQALAGANSAVVYATGGIVGSMFAPSPALATAPISVFVLGMAAGTLPSGWIPRRYGRKCAFIAGTACGAASGLLASLAILLASFSLFCVATFLGGLYAAVVLSFRFAATDGVGPQFRAKALSWVMAGGVCAGVLGPQLVNWTMNIWQPYLFAASYIAQAAVALVAMAVLWGVRISKPAPADLSAGRPLGAIVRQPRFLVAALCGVVSYVLMNFLMTSAPLAMKMCGLALSDSNLAIQWHVIAMYAPSFFTGSLIARFGAQRIVAAGLTTMLLAAASGLTGLSVGHFWVALILLGVGWNFGFVGASAMVLETHRPEERHKVQAFNDFLIFGIMALGSFCSGQMLTSFGWGAVNIVTLPPALLAFGVLLSSGLLRRRTAALR